MCKKLEEEGAMKAAVLIFDKAQLCATSLSSLIGPGVLSYFIHFFLMDLPLGCTSLLYPWSFTTKLVRRKGQRMAVSPYGCFALYGYFML